MKIEKNDEEKIEPSIQIEIIQEIEKNFPDLYKSLTFYFFFLSIFLIEIFLRLWFILCVSYSKSFKLTINFGTPNVWQIPRKNIGRTATEWTPSHILKH